MSTVPGIREVADIDTLLRRANTAEEAFAIALALLCSSTGWPIGHVFLASDESARDLVSSRVWHIESSERFAAFRRVSETIRIPPGSGLAGRALITGAPTWVADMAEHPSFARAGIAWETGIRAGAAFPVLVDGKVLAVVELFSEEVLQLDSGTRALGVAVANALGRRLKETNEPIVIESLPETEARPLDLSYGVLKRASVSALSIRERVEPMVPKGVT